MTMSIALGLQYDGSPYAGWQQQPNQSTVQGEVEKAIEHANKVVELEPDDTFSYTALSVIYVKCGKIPEAEAAKAMAFQREHGL